MQNKLSQIFGNVPPPPGVNLYKGVTEGQGGLTLFLSNLLKLIIVVAGLYALFNFVLAGYSFMSAGGDPKRIEAAWAKIWQTMIGLLFAAGGFVIAGIISKLIFGDAFYIFKLRVFGPG
jgi:hypothetical protein